MKRYTIPDAGRIIAAAVLCVMFSSAVFAQPAKLYEEALRAVRQERNDFAFMLFDRLFREYPESKYTQDAVFALGEYYFEIRDYRNARSMFSQYAEKYPESGASPIVSAYLIKLAQKDNDAELIRELESKIIGFTQASLLFREFKEFTYTSVFAKNYKIVFFIDKIEIFIDGELFHEISL